MRSTKLDRRDFLKAVGLGAAALAMPGSLRAAGYPAAAKDSPRPNILWISAEDISPTLGCYGDEYATTPNLDRFAAEGVRYDRAFAHAPVCAPARSGIITGMYPTHIGTTWMRCGGVPPAEAKCFPEYLRAGGYYCTNNSKTDYQFAPPRSAWDESGGRAHWRKRPDKNQPFFAVFNLGVTHESSTRRFTPGQPFQHEPAKAPLPPYYPDTPLVRQNLACYYDRMSQLDGQVKGLLDDLEAAGLAEKTIVWFWGDHGWGLTRGKRWVYDSGIRVPLMVRVPAELRAWAGAGSAKAVAPGRAEGELVSFIDFAPTMLSLAGIPIPKHMQGQAFLGPQKAPPRQYVFAARDRMDETYDCIRALRDKRFKYIRNFMPYLTRGQHIAYMDRTPILQEMRRLHAAGRLKPGPQRQFFEPTKPVHELYDTAADPHEVHNLAAVPKYKDMLARMSAELVRFMKRIGDVGLIPEPDFDAMKGSGTAAAPTFHPRKGLAPGAAAAVEITCATRGASITCQLVEAAGAAGGDRGTALNADAAKIHGQGARKSGGAIVAWRGRDTWISWSARLGEAGRQNVWVLQANAGQGGSQYELVVGKAKLQGTIRHTKGWDDYVWVKAGEVDVPKTGRCEVSLRPTKQVQGRLGNVSAVAIGGDRPPATHRGGGRWGLYSRPVPLQAGQAVRAQAWRLGYKPSTIVTYRCGEKPVPPQKPAEAGLLWRERLDQGDLLDRLLALKAYDGRWADGAEAYLKALKDADAPLRYWAIVGLHQAHRGAPPDRVQAAVTALLSDPSKSVSVAAAQALVDWGERDKGLARLVEVLASGGDKGSLFAAWALWHLGEKARPALERIQAAGTGRRAGGAVMQRVLARLKRKG